jgi:hypothetical protein
MDNTNEVKSSKNNLDQHKIRTETDMDSSSNELIQANKTINIDG